MPGQYWSPDGSGGYLANDVLSSKLRTIAQPLMKFRQFVRKEPGYGKGKGDTVLFDKISNVATAGGTISEVNKMPETAVAITQGSVIVNEWGNSVPYSGKLEALAEFSVNNIVLRALKDDMAKTLDKAVGATFQGTLVFAYPTGTTGAPTTMLSTTLGAATRDIQAYDVKEIVDAMKSTYLIPPFDGENYMCVCSVGFARKLKDDPDWEDAAKYGDPERLFSGEVGRYYGCRFVEETNVLANTLGTGSFKGPAIFFGADPVVEAVAVPEEIRAKIPTDYGRDKGLAWYFLGNWGLSWLSSTAGEVKVIYLSST